MPYDLRSGKRGTTIVVSDARNTTPARSDSLSLPEANFYDDITAPGSQTEGTVNESLLNEDENEGPNEDRQEPMAEDGESIEVDDLEEAQVGEMEFGTYTDEQQFLEQVGMLDDGLSFDGEMLLPIEVDATSDIEAINWPESALASPSHAVSSPVRLRSRGRPISGGLPASRQRPVPKGTLPVHLMAAAAAGAAMALVTRQNILQYIFN
jgi:hypothetical protein